MLRETKKKIGIRCAETFQNQNINFPLIPFTCIQFPLYEVLKKQVSKYKQLQTPPEPFDAAICGSIAGGVAASVTTPLDVIKTRVMLDKQKTNESYVGVRATLHSILKKEGVSGLFKGIVPRTLWISMGGFIFLGAYEKARDLFPQ